MEKLIIECAVCSRTLKKASLFKHNKSKKHLKNLEIYSSTQRECAICFQTSLCSSFISCSKCEKNWCASCSQNIFRCPFCRFQIPGLEEKEIEYERMLIDWYSSSESFQPSIEEVYIRVYFNEDNNEENISNVISNLQNLLRQRLRNLNSLVSLSSSSIPLSNATPSAEETESENSSDSRQQIQDQLFHSIASLAQEFEEITEFSIVSTSSSENNSRPGTPPTSSSHDDEFQIP